MPRRSNAAEQMPEPASQAKKSSKPVDEDVLRFYHKPPTRLKPKEVPDEKVVIRKDVKRKAEYASEIERPKVMIGKKALEAQEEAETMKRIEELRTKHNEATSVEKLSKRSETERSLAHKLINEFETGLKNGKITKSEMSHYRHELMEIRDKFEELQGQGVAISGEMQISDILNENLKVKDQVLDAIQASNMEDPQDALAKFKYGTGEAKYGQKHVVNVEKMEETDPEIISSQIEAKYGYHPEDLKSGNVKGLKGKWASWKFRIKDRLAHVAGISSQYDQYRQALNLAPPSAELKRAPKIAEKTNIEESKESEYKDSDILVAPALMAKSQKEYLLEGPITIQEAQRLIQHADKLWDFVNKKLEGNISVSKKISSKGEKVFINKNPATAYVLTMAKYRRAMENAADEKTLRKLKKVVDDFNKDLGIEGNALVQSSMLRPPNIRRVTTGAELRSAGVKDREKRSK